MSLAGAAARGALTSLVAQFLKFGVNLISIAVLARLLSPADYGVVAAVTAITGVAYVLSDFGLSMASIQSQSISHAQKSNLFWLNVALGVVLTVGVWASGWLIAALYGDDRYIGVTQAISGMLLLSALSAQFRAEATKRLKFRALAATDVVAPLAAFAVALAGALLGWGYWALVTQQLTQACVLLILLIAIARWWPGLPRRGQQMKALITFGVNSVGVQLINYVSNNLDSVLIGRFVGSTVLGYYSRAYQLFRLPLQQLAAPTTRVAFPILSRLNGTSQYNRYIERAQLVLTYVLGGAFFFAASAADPLIEIALGPGWDQTKMLFAILCVGGIFQALGYVYYWLFLSKAMTGLQLRYSLISRSIMIVMLFIGIRWGAVGVAVAMSAGLFVNWVILTVFAVPRTGVDVGRLVGTAVRPMLLYVVMSMILVPIAIVTADWSSWSALGVLCVAGVAIVALSAALVPPIRRDMLSIIDTVRKARR